MQSLINAGLEMQDQEMQDWKMKGPNAKPENAGPEFQGPYCMGMEMKDQEEVTIYHSHHLNTSDGLIVLVCITNH